TGPYIQFPIFFVLPVMLIASNSGLRWAGSLAVILCVIRFSFHFFWDTPWTVGVAVLNSVMYCSVLLVLAVVTARLAAQTRYLRTRVQTLEGILPICGFCKDIRDESGNWQRMESYVSKRSQAKFSHGLCPKCAEKHYGEFIHRDRNA
ncbi:MAG: hypothetical protein M3Y80_09690, partial [Verrucomicrobiota bacterium]|nr:hypothetical protein [Verrucomicrobiota bacterium]